MTEAAPAVINIADITLREQSHGQRFAARFGEVALTLGLDGLGCMLHIVPPGKVAFPFHRHHVSDEMFFIISGSGEYRVGDRRIPVKAGDCLGAPAGGAAHQIINTGAEDLRYLGVSDNHSSDVLEYPDSGQIRIVAGMKPGDTDFSTATFRKGGRLTPMGYWEGEEG